VDVFQECVNFEFEELRWHEYICQRKEHEDLPPAIAMLIGIDGWTQLDFACAIAAHIPHETICGTRM
jgi:hypothetical protein